MKKQTIKLKNKFLSSESIMHNEQKLSDLMNKEIITISPIRYITNFPAWTPTLITNMNIINSFGNNLTLSDNQIVIGEGISYVKISGHCSFYIDINSDYELSIQKNGELIEEHAVYGNTIGNSNCTINESIIPVQKGDKIGLYFVIGLGTINIQFWNMTQLTVEKFN